MMIIMRINASKEQVENVVERIEYYGLGAHLSQGEERTIIGAIAEAQALCRTGVPGACCRRGCWADS
jgi:3-deoxy-7-phosphoheptulonate synthase